MLLLALLAAAAPALPPPLSAEERADLRCVAVLAAVAQRQARGELGDLPPSAGFGRVYAGIVGDAGVEAGRTLEGQQQLMVDAAVALRGALPPRTDILACRDRALTRIAQDLPPPTPAPLAPK